MTDTIMTATVGRLYPTARQSREIARIGAQCRALWNHWLALNMTRYEEEKQFAFYSEMAPLFTLMRREPRYDGLPHRCGDRVVFALHNALLDAARSAGQGRKGFPRFKRRDDKSDSFEFQGRDVGIRARRIRLPKLGWVRVRGLRPEGKLARVIVRQRGDHWQVALQSGAERPTVQPAPSPAVGIDVGLTSLVTLSTGEKIAAPKFGRKLTRRVRRLEREKSRRRLGSTNRRRTVVKLNREHRRIAAKRRDFSHKLTTRIVQQHAGVAVEALNIRGLVRTRMARSMSDASLGELREQLRYKADRAGRKYREVPTFQRSTGVCPGCGLVGERLPLGVTGWTCSGCGAMHDRDVAAAQIILRSAVPVGSRELAAQPRKRGFAMRQKPGSYGPGRAGGPPSNEPRRRAVGDLP